MFFCETSYKKSAMFLDAYSLKTVLLDVWLLSKKKQKNTDKTSYLEILTK